MKPEDTTADLSALWQQEAPTVDTSRVIASVRASVRAKRMLDLMGIGFGFAVLLFVGWIEWHDLTRPRGILTTMVLASLAMQFWKLWRKKRIPNEASLAPVELLQFAIKKTKEALWMARAFYAGNPSALLLGYLVAENFSSKSGSLDAPDWLVNLAIGGILLLVAIGMVVGFVVARRKKAQLVELKARLEEIRQSL